MTDVRQEDATDAAVRTAPGGARPVDAAAPPTARPAVPRVDAKDPRYLALRNFAISMSIFNIIGYTLLGFEQPWTWPLFALLVGYTAEIGIEMVAAWAGKRRPAFAGNGAWGMYTFLLPTHITALAANMLLYANDRFWPVAFAVVVAIGAKAALRAPINGRMRHFMNPSNFGITVTLLAFSWVNIAPPYQFTENVPDAISIMVPLVIITAGTVLNAMLTRKVLLIVGWLGGFVIQAVVRALVLGRGDLGRAGADDRGGLHPVHQLHDHRSGHDAVPGPQPVHVRVRRGDGLRGAGRVQRGLHPLLRRHHRLRRPRPDVVGHLVARPWSRARSGVGAGQSGGTGAGSLIRSATTWGRPAGTAPRPCPGRPRRGRAVTVRSLTGGADRAARTAVRTGGATGGATTAPGR